MTSQTSLWRPATPDHVRAVSLIAPRTRAAEYPPLKRNGQGASPCRSTNFASVVKLLSSSASNGEFAGESPAGCANLIEDRVSIRNHQLSLSINADHPRATNQALQILMLMSMKHKSWLRSLDVLIKRSKAHVHVVLAIVNQPW